MENTIRRSSRESYARRRRNNEGFQKRTGKIIKQVIISVTILIIGITINNIDSNITNYLSNKISQVIKVDTKVDYLANVVKSFAAGLNINNEKLKSVFNSSGKENEKDKSIDKNAIPEELKDKIFDYTLLSDIQFESPTVGILTSGFGNRINPINSQKEFHNGIDIGADEGAEIKSVLDGVVEKVENSESLGNYVKIRHINDLYSLYAHASFIDVGEGDLVSKGSIIGKIGSTGWSSGPHLHFELCKDDKMINSEKLFNYKNSEVLDSE